MVASNSLEFWVTKGVWEVQVKSSKTMVLAPVRMFEASTWLRSPVPRTLTPRAEAAVAMALTDLLID